MRLPSSRPRCAIYHPGAVCRCPSSFTNRTSTATTTSLKLTCILRRLSMGYASPFLCLPARACATDCMLPRPRARSLRLCLVRKWWCRGLPTATTHRNISWTARRVRAQTSRSCWHPRGSTSRTTAFSSCRCATGVALLLVDLQVSTRVCRERWSRSPR